MAEVTTSHEATGQPEYGKLSVLSWAHFLNDGAANYLPGILPAILMSMGLSVSLAGVLMGVLVVGQGLQPFTGLLADRVGGRSFTVIGLGGGSIAAALVAFTPSLWTLSVALVLLGTANSLFHPQTLAAVRHSSGERHGMGMAVFMIGGEIGRGVWPLAASILVMTSGLESIWVLGIPGLLTLPFLWRASTPLPARRSGAANVQWHAHLKPLSIIVFYSGLRGILLYSVTAYVPVLWNLRGGSLAGGAGFITTMMIVGLVGNTLGGHLGDRKGRRTVIALGTAVAVVGMIAFMMVDGIWMWILIAVVGIGLFATFPLAIVIAQDIVPENRSFGSGMALGLSNAIGALGVMALGPVAGAWGVPAVLWVSILIGALSIPLLWMLPEKHYGA
jgi:MFS transporter, FSR family, fosmidomycin resistance protein